MKKISEFSKNIIVLLSGATVAQLIPILISPILTRIYTPEEFGLYTFFISIAVILSSISSGRYEQAIMIPKEDEEAIHILTLILIINTFVSLLFFILLFFIKDWMLIYFGVEKLGFWVYFLPIITWFTSLYSALSLINTRFKFYRPIANTTILKSIVGAILQVTGKTVLNLNGLILGNIVSVFAGNVKLVTSIGGFQRIKETYSKESIKRVALKFKNFPIYSLPGNVLNISSRRLVGVATPKMFGLEYIGHYSLAQRLLGLPLSYMSSSISKVYWQVSAEELREKGSSFDIFISTVLKLTTISFLAFGIFYFVIEDIFAFVFGEDWRLAGVYAKIMLPSYFFAFIISPISITLDLYEKQKITLAWQVGVFISLAFVFMYSYHYKHSFQHFLFLINWVTVIQYIVLFFLIFKVTKGTRYKKL